MIAKVPTAKIVLFTSKTLKTGEHPVMLRITYDRKQVYYSLKFSGKPDNWNAEAGRFKRNKEANIKLNAYENKAHKIFKDLERDDIDFTFDRFKKHFNPSAKPNYVFPFIENVIKDLMDEKRIGTARTYIDTLNRLKSFRNKKDLTFHDVDYSFLMGFKKHLAKTNRPNSIGIYFRTLRAIYNRAIKEGKIKRELYPFIDVEIPSEKPMKRALNSNQLTALKSYKAEPGSRMWHSLNFFLFSYYCRGMNFADMAKLTWDKLKDDRIFYRREKTKRKKGSSSMDIKITATIAEILANYSANDHYIFPILSPGLSPLTEKNRFKTRLKKVNADLQAIAKDIKDNGVDMPEDVTFYWARHSFATILKRSGVDTAKIKESLGHESEKTTQAYLDSFEREQLDSLNEYL